MVMSQKLTAEAMLGSPRRGTAVPNAKGTLALYTVATHSFEDGKTTREGRVMDLKAEGGPSKQLWTEDKEEDTIHDAVWIPGTDSHVMYLQPQEKGVTEIKVADAGNVEKNHVVVKSIAAPISKLKLKTLDDGSIVFAVAGQVAPDGSLFNSKENKPKSTGRVFDSNAIRIWNTLYEENRYSIWYTKLVQPNGADGNWKLAGELNNLVIDPTLEAPLGMYEVTDPLNNFDITSHGMAFVTRTLKQGIQVFVESCAWYIPIQDYLEPPTAAPRQIQVGAGSGAVEHVCFTPDGSKIALLYHDNEDWFNAKLMMCTPDDLEAFSVYEKLLGAGSDDDTDAPEAFKFAGSSDELIVASQRHGRGIISRLKLRDGAQARALTTNGSVSGFYPLVEGEWDKLLVTRSSFVDSCSYDIIDTHGSVTPVSSVTKNGLKFGLDWNKMVESFWYEGADGKSVQCWMIKPMDFDESKQYPWIFLPHGGPVSVWGDAWSTRWNVAMFAEQGYIVFLPNITGSTGFGKEFVRRIDNQWGGRAFTDLLKLLDELENRPYLDQSKAVLAGASYSGYLVSWFFGHEVAKKFCCAIWHDGLFTIPIFELQTDLLDFDAPFNGPPFLWANNDNLEKYNPATPERLANWKNAPPTVVIHSEKDYRCPITEGLAAFNTLLAQGVPARFLTFPDECHWVLKPENAKMWNGVVLDWVEKCVSGKVKRGDKHW